LVRPLRNVFRIPIIAVLMLFATIASYAALDRDGKPVAIKASVWELPKDGAALELATFDQPDPTTASLSDDTRLEGVCVHCDLPLQCRAADLLRRCSVCSCERTNLACLGGKASEGKGSAALFRSLPRGTVLRPVFSDPTASEKTIQSLAIDRHAALLPVEGLAGATARQIEDLGKSVRASQILRSNSGDRIEIHLKDNWSDDKVKQFEKALAVLDARLAPVPIKQASP